MPESTLRDTLADLRRQLEDPTQLESEELALLHEVHGEIEHLLDQTEETRRVEAPRVARGVGSAVERFESDHPRLTSLLNRLADTLASLGL